MKKTKKKNKIRQLLYVALLLLIVVYISLEATNIINTIPVIHVNETVEMTTFDVVCKEANGEYYYVIHDNYVIQGSSWVIQGKTMEHYCKCKDKILVWSQMGTGGTNATSTNDPVSRNELETALSYCLTSL